MKTTITFIAIFLSALSCIHSQINSNSPWTWVKGDNTIDETGIYGTVSVPEINNKPGARVFSTTWKDGNGNLWLFGGNGYTASVQGYLNDLWRYDPYNNHWTWMKGDSTIEQYSVYGTKGIANENNKPGATYASVSWTDDNNNLWLFGGYGFTNNNFGFLNSLWKYNTATNQWTWMKGDKTINKNGEYGTKGIAGTTNKPGARYGSLTWIDEDGNFWLFGGYGYDENSLGILNDMWKYNPNDNKWTWVNGDKNINQKTVYGVKGIAATGNKPGARYVSTCWKDADNNLWLFGGYGYDETNSGNLNDLWKYNTLTNEWAWMHGDKTINNPGVYGNRDQPDPDNKPGARYVSNSWVDGYGELWLFGGYGFDANSSGYLNDLWKFNTSTNSWAWVKGDSLTDQYSVYGTLGLPDAGNKSGGRNGALSWADGNGNLWLFGGYGFDGANSGILNDLWRISSLETVLPLKLVEWYGTGYHEKIILEWKTTGETGSELFIIERSLDGIEFTAIGQHPGKGKLNNQYSFPDAGIINRTSSFYYRLKIVNGDGKFSYSKVLRFDLNVTRPEIKLFPNPATSYIWLTFFHEKPGKAQVNIIAVNGMIVKTISAYQGPGSATLQINTGNLAASAYLIEINIPGKKLYTRFVKQ